jgi:hypothetical protein
MIEGIEFYLELLALLLVLGRVKRIIEGVINFSNY